MWLFFPFKFVVFSLDLSWPGFFFFFLSPFPFVLNISFFFLFFFVGSVLYHHLSHGSSGSHHDPLLWIDTSFIAIGGYIS